MTAPQKEYVIDSDTLGSMDDYFFAAIQHEESKTRLKELWKSNMSVVRSRPAPSPQNPCIENGCADIDDCDEICEHSRIYSPAWVKQHDTTIRNATLDEIIKIAQANNCVHPDAPCSENYDCTTCIAKSLRKEQP